MSVMSWRCPTLEHRQAAETVVTERMTTALSAKQRHLLAAPHHRQAEAQD